MSNDTQIPGQSENLAIETDTVTGRHRLAEVARLFLRLGFTAFGGPAAHIALIEHEVVTRRRWLDRQHFLDLVSAVNFIPGPNSTELAIHLGLIRAGWPGLFVAGICFIVPAVLLILPLGWLYVTYGTLPQVASSLGAIGAALVAIIVAAVVRFAQTSIKDHFTGLVALGALALAFALSREQRLPPELLILAIAAAVGASRYAWRSSSTLCVVASVPGALAMAASTPLTISSGVLAMALFFLRVGATLFGSGYVLVSYLHAGIVEQHRWMTEAQLLDAIAVGQVTPGPLLTTATFVGYFLGHRTFDGGITMGVLCGVLATAAIFLPSFVFVALLAPVLGRIRSNRIARGALDGMNAAVVALIVVTATQLAIPAFYDVTAGGRVLWLHVVIAVASMVILLTTKLNATWLIVLAGIIGAAADALVH